MSWFAYGCAVALCAGFVTLPGVAVLSALGASWWIRVVFAPVTSAALLACLGVVYAAVGLPFGPLTMLGGVAVIALAVRLALQRPAAGGSLSPAWWTSLGAGLLISAGIWLAEYVSNLTTPDSIGKGYDIPWHLSIVERMLTTGNASTLSAGQVVPTPGSGFYPASWHALAALVAEASGSSVPSAVNATIFTVMALVWSLSMVAFTTVVLGPSGLAAFATCLISTAFVAFPMSFVADGGLYANAYGYALLPALLAAALLLARSDLPLVQRAFLLVVAGIGTAVAQPNSIFTAWLVLTPFGLGLLYRAIRRRSRGMIALGICVAVLAVEMIAWVFIERMPFMHRTLAVNWPTFASIPRAAWQAATDGFLGVPATWWTAVAVAGGAVVAAFRARWLLVAHLLVCAFYVVTAATWFEHHVQTLRMYATGFWYHDSERLAAASVITAVTLVVMVLTTTSQWLARRGSLGGKRIPLMVGATVAVALACGSMLSPAQAQRADELAATSPMLPAGVSPSYSINADKVAFLRRVAVIVGTAGVANDPYDGSDYAYGLTGMNVTFKALPGNWMGSPSPDQILIRSSIDKVATDPRICTVLRRLHIEYVIQMARTAVLFHGTPISIDGNRGSFKGLEIHLSTPGFRLVLDEPQMRLWRIAACGSG